jgi:hypothetical protein
MASNPQIISDLRVIQETGHNLELLTTYKGVPFICRAKIEDIEEDLVRIKAQDPAMVCLEDDKKPRVLGSDYFEPSTAQVISFDILSGTVELQNFSYVGTKLGERMIVRVEPRDPIPVKFTIGSQEISGKLADLSISGLGVRIANATYSPTLKPGTNVEISMTLPSGEISMPGTVLSALKLADHYRLSIRFGQNGSQKTDIFRYLVDRRAEIEEELQAEFEATLQARKAAAK